MTEFMTALTELQTIAVLCDEARAVSVAGHGSAALLLLAKVDALQMPWVRALHRLAAAAQLRTTAAEIANDPRDAAEAGVVDASGCPQPLFVVTSSPSSTPESSTRSKPRFGPSMSTSMRAPVNSPQRRPSPRSRPSPSPWDQDDRGGGGGLGHHLEWDVHGRRRLPASRAHRTGLPLARLDPARARDCAPEGIVRSRMQSRGRRTRRGRDAGAPRNARSLTRIG